MVLHTCHCVLLSSANGLMHVLCSSSGWLQQRDKEADHIVINLFR